MKTTYCSMPHCTMTEAEQGRHHSSQVVCSGEYNDFTVSASLTLTEF